MATLIWEQTDAQRKATIMYISLSSVFVNFLFSHAIPINLFWDFHRLPVLRDGEKKEWQYCNSNNNNNSNNSETNLKKRKIHIRETRESRLWFVVMGGQTGHLFSLRRKMEQCNLAFRIYPRGCEVIEYPLTHRTHLVHSFVFWCEK